jgi:hypothetical protein
MADSRHEGAKIEKKCGETCDQMDRMHREEGMGQQEQHRGVQQQGLDRRLRNLWRLPLKALQGFNMRAELAAVLEEVRETRWRM